MIAGNGEELRVALLHRVEPDEWRLPKGKLHAGESREAAARREVAEELGVPVKLGRLLRETRYTYRSEAGPVEKCVAFFLARLPEARVLTPEAGTFDQAVWVSPAEALRLLSWENERRVALLALVAGSEGTPE